MIHDIDPIIGTVFGVHLWWYGLSYAAGFAVLRGFLLRNGTGLGLSRLQAYDLVLLICLGVLAGGRLVEVVFYEWSFYGRYPHLIPALWLGGMATHGLLLGAIAAIWLFCRAHGKSFLAVTDALAIPAAFILAFGRVGNFIDGQIVGSESSVWWAVKFPDADGFRHPTVLYDGLKNLLLAPLLIYFYRRQPPAGAVTGLFLFLYAFLRIGVDVFRVYPTSLLGLATGQALNIATSAIGLTLLAWSRTRRSPETTRRPAQDGGTTHPGFGFRASWRHAALGVLLAFSLVIPSDWTQDVPERYGKRHPGLQHSMLYPPVSRWTATPP